MDAATITSLILGTLGTVTGCYATWLSYKATRQELTVLCTDRKLQKFRVINYSLRPVPVQSIRLELKDDKEFMTSNQSPSLQGITLPGPLAPESCFDVEFELIQSIEMGLSKEFRLTVITQTGREFQVDGKIE